MRGLSTNDLEWFAARLSLAVYDTNRETPEMSVYELKQALRDIPGIETLTLGRCRANGNQLIHIDGRTLEVSPTASNEEIRIALQNPFVRTENTKLTTIGEQLKAARAKLAEVRQEATKAVALSEDAARVVLVEVNKVVKETDELRAEVAELTNGGPA